MDNNNGQGNPGSFMAPAGGGGDALKAAMEARGMGSQGVTNQNTTSPTAVPPSQPPQASTGLPQMQNGSPAPMPLASGGVPPTSAGNPEAGLILKAMDSYLKSLSKVNEAQNGLN